MQTSLEAANQLMNSLIENFPKNVREAVKIGESTEISTNKKRIENVVITGLGGSGIGGKVIADLVADECRVPIYINNEYRLPGFVSEKTLLIACSYSGNTEETLMALEAGLSIGASVACITSGGKLLEIAEKKDLPFIKIPGGQPPRTTFGYNAAQQFFILHAFGLIGDGFKEKLLNTATLLEAEQEGIKSLAQTIAAELKGTTPVIYCENTYEGVAVRLRQQINENSKTLCWHHVFPEMNHNELVGWAGAPENISVILLRNSDDYPRTVKRMELCTEVFKKHSKKIVTLFSEGKSKIERAYYLIHLGDWLSYYWALELGNNPVEINVIDYLKDELAKHN